MKLPPFYTARYVEVRSPVLSFMWLLCGIAIVLYTLIHSLLGEHNYVQREVPSMDVTFWQDVSVGGKWWPQPAAVPPAYCDTNFYVNTSEGFSWGSSHIGCKRPSQTPGTYFYPSSNEMLVAFSVAYGQDAQYNSNEIYIYEGIEQSTLGFQLSFITSRQHVAHVPDCRVIGDEEHPDGDSVQSRYSTLLPKKDYGDGYLLLSIEDIFRAAGRNLSGFGSEGPLLLTGLEIVAKFDLRNYHVPFRWPSDAWPALWGGSSPRASERECTVRFEVLRDQFTQVKWFYDKTEPVALQHGLRLVAVGTGSIGYFSFVVLLEKLLLGFAAFGLAQVVLDLGWYYFFSEAETIRKRAYAPVELPSQFSGLPFRSPSYGSKSLQLPHSHGAKFE